MSWRPDERFETHRCECCGRKSDDLKHDRADDVYLCERCSEGLREGYE
jgi:hypothetical protein